MQYLCSAPKLVIHGIFFLCCLLPLPAHAIMVHTVAELVNAVNATVSGGDKNILVGDGTYNLAGEYLRISVSGVTVSSASGDRDKVVLDGNYETTEIFQIVASNTTIANMTLKRAYDHPVHIMSTSDHDVTDVQLLNLHIVDPGQQAVKINPDSDRSHTINNGIIRGCFIELTDTGRDFVWKRNGSCYTGGIDAHLARAWRIEDNVIEGFWCSGSLSEHGIHFWSDSEDTLVQRNLILDCDRGIGFGLGSSGHLRGIIRNNMIWHGPDHGYSDVGIGLESTTAVQVYNNTIFHEHAYPNAIEYRFTASNDLIIANNLCNREIVSRDGGTTTLLSHNMTTAPASWFVAATNGNLHLNGPITGVVDAGLALSGLSDDFDRQPRPAGNGMDIGADEYGSSPSTPTPPGKFTPAWLLLLLQ